MIFKNIFGSKQRASQPPRASSAAPPRDELNIDVLDDCVGGRTDKHDVDVYMKASNSGST